MPAKARSKQQDSARVGVFAHLIAALAALVSLVGIVLLGDAIWLAATLKDPEQLRAARNRAVVYLDRSGEVLARRAGPTGPFIGLDDMPGLLPEAVLALEDRSFYRHVGLDPVGLARAALANLRAGRVVQGGSTITQQVAKSLYLSGERNLARKRDEFYVALYLEARYSKREILALYLNTAYFGGGAFGVEAAAQRYFGKSAKALSLGETALIAGLLRAPSLDNPLSDPDRTVKRVELVLDRLRQRGAITEEARAAALATPITVLRNPDLDSAGYVVDWLARFVARQAGDAPGPILVETTIDAGLQRSAEEALRAELAAPRFARAQGAIYAIDASGAVRAMVGGRAHAESPLNRTQSPRQPGSAFKPIVYFAALAAGAKPESLVVDAPIDVGDWRPRNFRNEYRGTISLAEALAVSANAAAVALSEQTGRDQVVEAAKLVGLEMNLSPHPSIALGAQPVSLADLTQVYCLFASGGIGADEPVLVTQIRDGDGRVLYRAAPKIERRVEEAAIAPLNRMLAQSVAFGTGRAATLPGRVVIGKTGTTNAARDLWFIGGLGGFAAGVWIGVDAGEGLGGETGGGAPARVWRAMMAAHAPRLAPSEPPLDQPIPASAPWATQIDPRAEDAAIAPSASAQR